MLTHTMNPLETNPFVTPFTMEGHGHSLRSGAVTAPLSATYPSANRAYYFPIVVPMACTVYRLFWLNGATASTNNIQVGVYNDNDAGTDGPGTSFLLGTATTASGANVCQFDNVTDTPLPPGHYWLALWGNGTTTTIFRYAGSATFARTINGYIQDTLTTGLPTTATPAQNTTSYVPVFGFTTISSP